MSNNSFVLKNRNGQNLREALAPLGANVVYECGGNGTCGSCKARISKGDAVCEGTAFSVGDIVKICQCKIVSDFFEVELLNATGAKIKVGNDFFIPRKIEKNPVFSGIHAVALDIGTTTLAAILFELEDGKILAKANSINPQVEFGGDVLSRISASGENPLAVQKSVLMGIENLIFELLGKADLREFSAMMVAGNTAMLHLFLGADARGLGRCPWTPAFLNSREVSSKVLFERFPEFKIITMPSISAFVGADLSAACAVANVLDSDENILIIDIGTNGEVILKIDGEIFSASAAAGPAFEGYGLTCGKRAEAGAICAFVQSPKRFSTINGARADGICGSGYIDFLAQAHKCKAINDAGRLQADAHNVCIVGGEKRLVVDDKNNVFVTEKDIENLLKSKAAIYACIQTLLDKTGAREDVFDKIYIAGGFGKNINFANAKYIGLLQNFDDSKLVYLGNSALAGAYACAMEKPLWEKLSGIDGRVKNVELNAEPAFEDNYIDALFINRPR